MPMTPEELDRFLAEPLLAHFATIDDRGHPRVRPLWFVWRDGVLWFSTRLGARHTGRDLRSNPRVAVSIGSEDRPYRAVLMHGTAELLDKSEEMLRAVAARYVEDGGRAFAAGVMQQEDRVLVRVVPDAVMSWDYAREETDGSKRTPL